MVWEGKVLLQPLRKNDAVLQIHLHQEPGTIKGLKIVNIGHNIIHGFECPLKLLNVKLAFSFKQEELVSWQPSLNSGCTPNN